MLTRVSIRASGPPGQLCGPRPKARCSRELARSSSKLCRVLEMTGIAVGGAVEHHQRATGRDVHAADGGPSPGQPEVTFHRRLDPEHLLDEAGDEVAPFAEELLQLGALADQLQCGAEQPDGGLLPGGEEVGGDADHVDDLGQGPSGKVVVASVVSTSWRGSRRRSSTYRLNRS